MTILFLKSSATSWAVSGSFEWCSSSSMLRLSNVHLSLLYSCLKFLVSLKIKALRSRFLCCTSLCHPERQKITVLCLLTSLSLWDNQKPLNLLQTSRQQFGKQYVEIFLLWLYAGVSITGLSHYRAIKKQAGKVLTGKTWAGTSCNRSSIIADSIIGTSLQKSKCKVSTLSYTNELRSLLIKDSESESG